MGGSQSSPENMGWRVLDIIPGSPSADKGFLPYFDFIVGVNGVRLNTSSEMLGDVMLALENQQVELTVFNFKTRIKRTVTVSPSSNWGGEGVLGLIVVPGDFTKANEQCIRILKVHPKSPAERSGLVEQTDYLLGTPVEPFTDINKFTNVIHDFVDRPLPVWVYSSSDASLRKIAIEPSSRWHGQGVLGCEVGGGLIHHIPSLKEDQDHVTLVVPATDGTSPPRSNSTQSNNEMKSNHTTSTNALPSSQPQPTALSPQTLEQQYDVKVTKIVTDHLATITRGDAGNADHDTDDYYDAQYNTVADDVDAPAYHEQPFSGQ